jgi:hypothetical protein
MPVARRDGELWYGADQIKPYGSDIHKPFPIKVVQGGTMNRLKGKRRSEECHPRSTVQKLSGRIGTVTQPVP